MAKSKKKVKKQNKIAHFASIAVIVLVFLSVIIYNIITLFLPINLITSEGEILKKEKAVHQNVKVPELNYYFTIIDKEGETKKYKINQILFNSYNESDEVSFKYKKKNNEIVDIIK